MAEPTIICPNCKTEIKLTESLAAPLIESTRHEYEKRLAQKDTDVAKRDAALREREEAITKAQQTIDDQVNQKLHVERAKITAEEAKRPSAGCRLIWTKRRKKSLIFRKSSNNGKPNWRKRRKRKRISCVNSAN